MNKETRNLKERQKGLEGLEGKKKEQNNVINYTKNKRSNENNIKSENNRIS